MSVEDYMFDMFEDKWVVHLKNNRLEKVTRFSKDFIQTEDGHIYFLYLPELHKKFGESIMSQIDIKYFLWTAKEWKRECYLNILI